MQARKTGESRDAGRPLQFTMKRGYEVLRDPHLNKGMAFTLEERQQLNIHGLLPPCFLGQDAQVVAIVKNFERLTSDLDRKMETTFLPPLPQKLSRHHRGCRAALGKSRLDSWSRQQSGTGGRNTQIWAGTDQDHRQRNGQDPSRMPGEGREAGNLRKDPEKIWLGPRDVSNLY